MLVEMKVKNLAFDLAKSGAMVFLEEMNGKRILPIWIGIFEANAIALELRKISTARPMTHDLLAKVIEAMGGEVEKVVISDLREHTFIATLYIRQNGELIEVDARPSDAIALGVGLNTPLFVADHVFNEILNESVSLADQRENLQRRRDELIDQINQLEEYINDAKSDPTGQISEDQIRELQQRLREMHSELEAIEEILRHLPE